ncbi:tetratricopeptide repeat protein [Actinomadura hibisca]|uniref:tetratricopeptide repeat protein n=1 Tax=Actinomadura hibisca TaxID=68565 RepID=UPI00083099E2|nr:tetratricopeptide repeat protein [Actinomadura hibisca]
MAGSRRVAGATSRVERVTGECLAARERGEIRQALTLANGALAGGSDATPLARARIQYVQGLLLFDSENLERAEHAFTEAVRLAANSAAPDAPGIGRAAEVRLGNLYRVRGAYEAAEIVLRRVLGAIDRELRVTGPNPALEAELVSTCNELAVTYKYFGKFTEARDLYLRALSLLQRALGPDHCDVATVYHNLGGLAHARRDFHEAERPARRALAIRERVLGTDHIDVAAERAALAPILMELGRLEEAEELMRQALTALSVHYGDDHYQVAIALHNLAAIVYRQGRAGDAEPLFQRSLRIKEKALGPHHPELAGTLNNLALLRRKAGDRPGAVALYERGLRILLTTVVPAHPALRAIRQALADLRDQDGSA